MARQNVWLDCDPGHDDALAIMLAAEHPGLRLLGVSTVACNQSIDKTTTNALAVLHAIGRSDIPVYQGQHKPLIRPATHCADIHGETGLDAPEGGRLFPPSPVSAKKDTKGVAIKAVNAMAAAILEVSGPGEPPVQLICTGALTNAALLIALYPEVVEQSRAQVTIMGGALGVGNTGPVQEFNIQTDPEAAKLVFDSGIPLAMVPIEVTHTVLATPAVCDRITTLGTPFSGQIIKLLTFFASTYRTVFNFEHPPVHDPVAVALVAAPHLFTTELMRVDIETASVLSAGQTVCDVWHTSALPKNCRVARSVDVDAVWLMMLEAIAACNSDSPLNAGH